MSVITNGVESIKRHRKAAILVGLVVLTGVVFLGGADENSDLSESTLPVVTVTTAAKISGEQEISVVGNVRAFSEAVVTTESTGRVTSVNATLGQTVPAGFVVATLENASQRAAVLQAEGSYEAALAAAQQSNVGLDEAQTGLRTAQNNAVSTFKDSYNTVNGVIRNNIDLFFSNPQAKVPGLKIDGRGQTAFLNNERVTYQTLLPAWQLETTALTVDSDLMLALENASARIERTIVLVDTFISLFNTDDRDLTYSESELIGFSTTFTGLRSNLQAAQSAVNTSLTALQNAEAAVRRARIGSTGSTGSAADAQVKQALGALRAAQANLAKTILRTPISGTVNSINVRVGDFIGNQEVVARVANNNALEIVTFVGDNELNAFVTGAEVAIENRYTGVITEVAPAVDPVTRKTEVRIAVESDEIQNGDTVTISKTFTSEAVENQPVIIPLSAVKFEIEDGFIFSVADGSLVSRPVTLGTIRGGSVEIISGLSITDEFVLDARGLLEGTEVEVRTQ